MNYKNEKDPDFVYAAQLAIGSLNAFIDWANMVLAKSKDDPYYKHWMSYCTDFEYEKCQSQNYIKELNQSIILLSEPDKSTPEQRYNSRELIAQCRTWNIAWDNGANQRDIILDGTGGDAIDPEGQDWLPVLWPSAIVDIMVPAEFVPGYDPFKDN